MKAPKQPLAPNVLKIEAIRALQTVTDDVMKINVPDEILALIIGFFEYRWDQSFCPSAISTEYPTIISCSNSVSHRNQLLAVDARFGSGEKGSFTVNIVEHCIFTMGTIGVVPIPLIITANAGVFNGTISGAGGWEWWSSCSHLAAYGGRSFPVYHSPEWVSGDVITVLIDFSHKTMKSTGTGTVSFVLNGKYLGIAFDRVVPPVQPAVCLSENGDTVEIVDVQVFED